MTGMWEHQSDAGTSAALAVQPLTGMLVGASCATSAPSTASASIHSPGAALFSGPTFYWKISELYWMSAAWTSRSPAAPPMREERSTSPISSGARRCFASATISDLGTRPNVKTRGSMLALGHAAIVGLEERRTPQMKFILACAAVVRRVSAATAPAEAKGCLKGAVVGGIAGHVAHHHAVVGAIAGCLIAPATKPSASASCSTIRWRRPSRNPQSGGNSY